MHIEIKGVHYDISESTKEFIDKKMKRIGFAEDLLVDLLFTITRETNRYKVESNINFRWGGSAHIRTDAFELYKGIEILFDKLELKIKKEKDKIQEHQNKHHTASIE
jgi:putative sigma-54 modulation protein